MPAPVDVANAPIPMQILAQSPADADTDLQVICVFRSSAVNTLHGSLAETNEKLKGLLDRIRKPELFGGELGETLLIATPKNSLGARKLLIIGQEIRIIFPRSGCNWWPDLYGEARDLGVAHPFFAPTILDGGVAKFTTGQVAEKVISGFLRAALPGTMPQRQKKQIAETGAVSTISRKSSCEIAALSANLVG